jgi:hypothetical protein
VIHRGEIVEKVVRRSGYPLTKLSSRLGISRNTLYNRFLYPNLSGQFISEVGKLIHHDFTVEFPELKKETSLMGQDAVLQLERNHELLAKRFSKLLAIVQAMAQANKFYHLQQELEELQKE